MIDRSEPEPSGDPARLAAFAPYDLVDTAPEAEYDDLVRLAAQICAVPISLISFVLADRQWFKAETGLGVRETKLESSVCRHLLLSPGLTQIPDLRDDPRSADNPLVTEQAGLRFYAGYLLATPEGVPLGSLCVLDREPRPAGLSPEQQFALTVLARHLSGLLELRRALRQQQRLIEQKEILFQEMNHRVANSLQMAASLLQLQSAVASKDGAARGLLAAARNRVLAIGMLHEQLYRSREVSEIELGGYLRRVVETVASLAAVEATVESATAIMLPTERAVAAALIANELVTNAVKHAAPAHAALRIQVTVDAHVDASCSIVVGDNGAGLPAGFDYDSCTGLGIRIVRGLINQLCGQLSWVTGPAGTRFRLEFPSFAV